MPRFFAAPPVITDGSIRITGEDYEHMRVLRLKSGEHVDICDGAGTDYGCELSGFSEGAAILRIVETRPSLGEPDIRCTVFAAFMKGERIEYAVQKSVELGAYEIVLFPSARCIAVPESKALDKKLSRLQKIALEAAKQCGRGITPRVLAAGAFEDAVRSASGAELPLFFYEEEKTLRLSQTMDSRPDVKTVSIVTGPEGGFEPPEAEFAASGGLLSVSLGPRILRCETAPVCALAAVMYATGNL